jgi:glycosyltransferase involved in cell wall biosynthesis
VAASVTVVTPSLPSRGDMLAEAMATVTCQTMAPIAHAISVDHGRRGPAAVRNDLLAGVTTEWVAFLDDDDLLDESHLEILVTAGYRADAAVVVPYCRFGGPSIPPRYCNQVYDRAALADHGIFPITVLAKTEAIRRAGCFGGERYEDWALWNRMADQGAFFLVVPEETWTYRLGHGDHRTHGVNVA